MRANIIDWKKKPIELETMYNVFLFAIAEIRKRNNPDQIKRIIDNGGKTVECPRITEIVVGSVAPWISNIPIHPDIFAK